MKTNIVKWTALAATSMALIGCDLFGTDGTDSKELAVTGVALESSTAKPGDAVVLNFEVESEVELTSVDFQFSLLKEDGTVDSLMTQEDEDMMFPTTWAKEAGAKSIEDGKATFTLPSEFCNGVFQVEVVASAGSAVNGASANLTIEGADISCTDALNQTETPLGEAKSGVVNNVMGPDQGAFDLVKGEGVSSSGEAGVKDLLDITATADLGSGNGFKATLSSGNESVFAVVTDVDFATVTAEGLAASMESAEKSFALETPELKAGDVVIVGLGGDRGAAILSITEVVLTTDDNKDMIKFDYKLLTFDEEM